MSSGTLSDDFTSADLSKLIDELHRLERERAQFKSVLDQMPEGIFIARAPDGASILMNEAAAEMVGPRVQYPDREGGAAAGQRQWGLQYPDGTEVPHDQWPVMRALRGETGHKLKYQFIAQDGRLRHLLVNFSPLCEGEGAIFAGLAIFRDITGRKPSEEALRETEERFRAFVEQSTEGIWCVELEEATPIDWPEDEQIEHYFKNAYLTECNDVMAQMYGYDRKEELLGVRLGDFLIYSDPYNIEYLRAFIRSGYRLTDAESHEIDREGNPKYFLNNLVGIIENGCLTRAWGTQRDITNRKRDEEALRESEGRFSKAFNASPLPVTISTLDEGRYIDANESFLRVLGYAREEVIGRTSIEIAFWADPANRAEMLRLAEEGKEIRDLEINFRLKSGETRLGTVSAEVIELHGKPCLIAVTNDITERKRAEKIQSAVYRISEAANSAETLQELFRSIHEIVGHLMPADNFFIAMCDRASETLHFPYYVDERDPAPAPRKLGRGLSEYVLRTGTPLQAPPPVLEELARAGEAELIGAPSVDWFGVPLKTKTETFGVLAVQSYTEGLEFGEEEKNILLYVSTQVAAGVERKRAEEALRESERRLDLALRGANLGLWDWNIRTGETVINERWAETLGYVLSEIKPHISLWEQIVHPDDLQAVKETMFAHLKGETSFYETEHRLRTVSGEWKWMLDRGKVVERDETGRAVRAAGTQLDITERKLAEEALRKVVEGVSDATGEAFFLSLVKYLVKILEVDFAFFGKLAEENVGIIETIAVCVHGRIADNFRYELANSPCEGVVGKKLCCYPEGIQQLFPEDAWLAEKKVESYLGAPLWASTGRPLGLLAVMGQTPLRKVEFAESILQIFAAHASAELERLQTEAALRENEQRYRALFENANDIIYTQDFEGNLISVNKVASTILGYTREELLDLNIARMIAPEQREKARRTLKLREAGENIPPYRLELIAKDGRRVVLEINAQIISQDGKPVALHGVARDVTERMRAEAERAELLARERAARNEAEQLNRLRAELLEREQAARAEAETARSEWQTTFDAMTDSVLIVDLDDRLIRANQAFYARLKLAPEDCLGRPVGELVHENLAPLIRAEECPICELRRKGEHGAIELPAGVIGDRALLASIDPIIDGSGKTIAVIQIVRDQMDLYQARQEAERERTSLNATIEQMAEGLTVHDKTGTVIRANRHAQRIFGYTLDEMRADRDFVLPVGRFTDEDGLTVDVEDLPVQTALSEQHILDSRLWYSGPDGEKVLLSFTVSPFFNDQNRLEGAILLTRDVTEQQREYERAQQADKLRALGQLASGVAHNFNNALAAILGYSQLAIPKVKDTDVEKYLQVVEQSAKDAARMVERIQNFSRGHSYPDDFIHLRLSDIVRDSIEITRPRWRDDAESLGINYEVTLDWQPCEDVFVEGEPSELREVFVNIILNALDAMPVGGRLTITASAVSTNAILKFTDTGAGMTEEIKRRIFEPFFTTKGVSGLGMGLSESYRILERHSGRIEAESKLRVGTTFTVTLPVATLTEPIARLESAESRMVGARVLVIDDEKYVRGALAAMLVEQGHEVMEAAGAEEAFEALETNRFDLVFTDLAMPRIDGIAAATEIKSRSPRTRIVLMSGYGADKVYELIGDSACIDATLFKPFKHTDVQRVVNIVLRNAF